MALRKDGNTKNSSSYKPYDRSNSFVKKMTSTVTGLFNWRSNMQSESQVYNDVSDSATDDEVVLPAAKRMRTRCEEEATLLKFIPNSNKTLQGACSPIQPVNDISVAGPSNSRSTCIASSTPANFYSSVSKNAATNMQQDAKTETPNTRVVHDKEESINADTSTTLPLFNIHQRHNVTVPSISRDMPSRTSNTDTNKPLFGSFSSTNSRRPSFNVDAFSTSNRRLSLSVCENRNRNCLSPFYKARTMYGGASALLPYGGQTLSRMRSASTSNLDVFAPRSQITMQPVPSPSISNDQETMSAAARRILDTLEKYCSPVADAKRIPLNEFSKKNELQQTSRGLKRKLPTLTQMMPSTSDLLRIKRTEKLQDSISSAKQTAASVPESTIATEDSDSSLDSVELDYSVLTNVAKNASCNDYLSKVNRKTRSKFDDRPLTPVRLPKAELKITNLPKFNVTDMFTFSKPLLLENLDQSEEEEEQQQPTTTTATIAIEVENFRPADDDDDNENDDQKSTPSNKKAAPKKRAPHAATATNPSKSSPKRRSSPTEKKSENDDDDIGAPRKSLVVANSNSNLTCASKSNIRNTSASSWTCRLCLANNNTGERCSGCSSDRRSPQPVQPPKTLVVDLPSQLTPTPAPPKTSALPEVANWGDKFKPPSSDTWECKECFVRNQNACDKCVACSTSKNNVTSAFVTTDVPDGGAPPPPVRSVPTLVVGGSNDLWKHFQKAATDQWKCDSCWVQNKKEEAKCVSCGMPKEGTKTTTVAVTTSTASSSSFSTAPSKMESAFGANKSNYATIFGAGTIPSTEGTFKFGVEKPAATSFTSTFASTTEPKSIFSFGATTTSPGGSMIAPTPASTEHANITSSVPQITFGNSKKDTPMTEGAVDAPKSTSTAFTNSISHSSPFGAKNEGEKKETVTFNDVSSSTNAKAANVTSAALKATKFGVPRGGGSPAAKENGGEEAASGPRAIFNDISSSTESPSKRKSPMFSYLFAAKESNGLARSSSEANSVANGGVAFVSSSSSGPFGGIPSSTTTAPLSNTVGTATKLSNSTSSVFAPSFKNDPTTIDDKKLFTNSSSSGGGFAASSTNPTMNSFGNIAAASSDTTTAFGRKSESTTTSLGCFGSSSSMPAFHFAANSTISNNATAAPGSGGFSFNNAPKTEDSGGSSQTKFVFGGTNVSAGFGGSGGTPFSFGTPVNATPNDRAPLTNSLFANAKQPQDIQPMASSNAAAAVPPFTNNIFGATSLTAPSPQPTNAVKKSGGFNYAPPTHFGSSTINSFSGFLNAPVENQEQNRLNNSTAPTSSPYVFGASSQSTPHNFNLTIPSSFNFTGGNAVPSFTGPPAPTGAAQTTAAPRRIKKAVRRTTKN